MALATSYVILWASQTGNAEWIAKNIHTEAKNKGYRGECYLMDEWEKANLATTKVIIFVASNTGDGDPPDNALKFWRFFRRMKQPDYLAHAQVTLLGLGDTNYSNYNNTVKRLEKKAKELGATVFYEKGLADDAEGLETVVDPWIEKLWTVLPSVLQKQDDINVPKEADSADETVSVESVTKNVQDMSVSDPYTNEARRTALPKEAQKYTDLPNSLINKDATPEADGANTNLASGHPLTIDLSGLKPGMGLTALPKVPASITHLERLDVKTVANEAHRIPEFINIPSPLIDAAVTKVQCLTTKDALKRTLFVELEVDKEIQFDPGDAFGILAPNDDELVEGVLARLVPFEERHEVLYAIRGEDLPSHLQNASRVTLVELLKHGLDLTSQPRKALFRLLAEYTTDLQEKTILMYICSKQGVSQFNAIREQSPTLLDILATFPSCKPPISRLLDALPPHMPRYYSISNSPLKHPGKICFAFNVINYTTAHNVKRKGVATPWIDALTGLVPARIKKPTTVEFPSGLLHIPIFMKPNANTFTLPTDTTRPLVLIGPGTGIAPFIGFLEHRQTQRKIRKAMGGVGTNPLRDIQKEFGDIWVYYGFRETTKDYLFEDDLENFVKDGTVKKLELAVSRKGKDKVYVQDLLKRDIDGLYEMIVNKNAVVYICGDAKGMAKGVHDALADMLCEKQGLDKLEANKLLIQWMSERKYLRDLWA
ncbi:hypothetical protein J3Q64DRAFT_1721467 [Phycomyces blakesleeanus]|uniref:Methionine synthase reductase n=2 Tax=Phycomyces blakesleeanus TaxID=4837 RepID=A0A162PX75_PHYB8|nr:hypothetical protein PHYBLDRAFT_180241 [Phycomyces blakesleeanus NRRL 1555(-)]OAD76837.1 hypothetical protein PHYBLDRAFT_180241 [Phycomyces blakesleeanus NRRL 1555(-)]|eukprot:XP_018294877.1 hypothetical protein PHYBLDRAFT_180241 [Phycomyces blakesleeanus NRRL 1555(-)]